VAAACRVTPADRTCRLLLGRIEALERRLQHTAPAPPASTPPAPARHTSLTAATSAKSFARDLIEKFKGKARALLSRDVCS
jgi:BMFP domain-containing protein YqiC